MKKILILGSGGAGKSTFSKKLAKKLNLELIHLDHHYWKPNWKKTPKEEWGKEIEKLCQKEAWIMDGNYQSTLNIRIPTADTIILLNTPPLVCLWRILKRRITKGKRIVAPGCPERITLGFIWWILWLYPKHKLPETLEILKKHKNKKVFILKTTQNKEKFLETLI